MIDIIKALKVIKALRALNKNNKRHTLIAGVAFVYCGNNCFLIQVEQPFGHI